MKISSWFAQLERVADGHPKERSNDLIETLSISDTHTLDKESQQLFDPILNFLSLLACSFVKSLDLDDPSPPSIGLDGPLLI